MLSAVNTRARHWRFRFSLRTLLLFSILCGAGMWLWRNWGPWVAVRTVVEKGAIVTSPTLDPEDQFHITVEERAFDGVRRVHVIRNMLSGRLISSAVVSSNDELNPFPSKPGISNITASFTTPDPNFLMETFDNLGIQRPKYDCWPPFLLKRFFGDLIFVDSTTVVAFDNDPERVTLEEDPNPNRKVVRPHDILLPNYRIWKQVRPPMWYGVFWLPQFWLAAFMLLCFFVSLWRDNRIVGAATVDPA